jgi:CRISPR-associated protein Cmr6
LPSDTSKYIKELKKQDNFALFLNKIEVNNFEKKDKFPKIWNPKGNFSIYYQNLKKLNLQKKSFELKIADKLIIGLGSASVYETSITLHHIYGVPYIPASAIKGSFRSYLIHKYFENELKKYDDYSKFENEILFKTKWFVDIFGTEDIQGKVYFFDSFSNNIDIKKDIMNPHYPDYYDKKQPPTDTQNPKPINFLTISGKFEFMFGVKEDFEVKIKDTKYNILEFIENELQNSLKEFGIGAKTSVGYGYFN